jgi:hypothetical protein
MYKLEVHSLDDESFLSMFRRLSFRTQENSDNILFNVLMHE